jgi:hypothetical protein
MKKFFSIICCAIMLLAVSSCTKQYVTTGSNNVTVVTPTPIASSDWTLDTSTQSYTTSINVPEITPGFVKTGGVIVAISGTDGVYEQVPEVYGGTSFSYTYNQGNVTLYAQSPDGATPIQPTATLKVKITLVTTN